MQNLVPIFQKIGAADSSEQGLEELRDLMLEHPEVDKTQLFARLSPEFCAFVEKGLSRLERRSMNERPGQSSGSLLRYVCFVKPFQHSIEWLSKICRHTLTGFSHMLSVFCDSDLYIAEIQIINCNAMPIAR